MKHLYFHLKKDPEDEVVAINGIKWGNLWPVPLVNNSETRDPSVLGFSFRILCLSLPVPLIFRT